MNFGTAMINVINLGQKARRVDWNRVSHIELTDVEDYKGERFELVVIRMKSGKQGQYSPSSCDMLSDDWYIVDDGLVGG